ncbi:DDE-type integrase/transposase/recombinase, partial [Candidatus Kaiserbacteria bacterium]|nr:DDE-type integrase/transposase/recombinase [Candidatus Kaiserbacteria bacterium]
AIDYRLINAITEEPTYPIPRIDELVLAIKDKEYLASLDMSSAYHQFPLAEEDQIKSTITCEFGLFSYTRVPFGMSGAVTYFQSRMEEILQPAKDELDPKTETISSYIDDIVVGGNEFINFVKALLAFFRQFRIKNCKISTEKSEFGVKEITYLGYRVNAHAYYPNPDRMSALLKRAPPTNLTEIRGLVSNLSFYNRFLPYLADLIEPFLVELRRLQASAGKRKAKSIKCDLPAECKRVWEQIKEFIMDKIVLQHIDPAKDFLIFVDASDVAAGAVIFQRIEEKLKVVAFYSKLFNSAQRNYSASEREMLGIIMVLDKFRTFLLFGPKIHVFTDHQALVSVITSKAPTKGRLERWRNQLHDFRLIWHHLPGQLHGAADWLSRPNAEVIAKYEAIVKQVEEDEFDMTNTPECLTISQDEDNWLNNLKAAKPFKEVLLELDFDLIKEAQQKDEFCKTLLDQISNALEDSNEDEYWAAKSDELAQFKRKCARSKEGLLLVADALTGSTLVPVLPSALREEVIRVTHEDELGHFLGKRVFTAIAERCNWPGMRKDIQSFMRKCEVCLKFNPGLRFESEPGYFGATKALEQITFDVAHMKQRKTEYPLVLCAEDTFTRWMWLMPLKNETAEEQIRAIRDSIMSLCHKPKEFITDRHAVYLSKAFNEFLKLNKIKLSISKGYWSTHVALVNRAHRTMRSLLAKCCEGEEDWVTKLPIITCAYNHSIHPATGFSPYFMLFCKRPSSALDGIIPLPRETQEKSMKDIIEEYEKVCEIVTNNHVSMRMKQLADFERNKSVKKRQNPKINERVMKLIELNRLKDGKQAAVKAYGPYVITDIDKDNRHAYIIQEFGPKDQTSIRVRWEELVPIGDRICTPIYSPTDIVKSKVEIPDVKSRLKKGKLKPNQQ